MAGKTLYDWGDGHGRVHTISLAAHQANVAQLKTPAAPGFTAAQAQQFTAMANNPAAGLDMPGMPKPKLPVALAPAAAPAAAAASPAPGVTAGTPATTPATSAITPDAEYLSRAAQAAFQRTTQINRLTQEGQDDNQTTQTAINRLIENALRDRAKISEGANKEGLFYSGQLTKRTADYDREFNRSTGDMQTAYSQRDAAREAARKAIEQGAPLDDAVDMADAAVRQIARDTSAADLNSLVPDVNVGPASTQVAAVQQLLGKPIASSPQPKTPAKAKPKFTVKQGNGGVWHVYPDGRRVWVPKRR